MTKFAPDIEHSISISCDDYSLEGLLFIPKDVTGIVIFAHGSGSSRLSTRNQAVAKTFQHAGFATLLFDLLTEAEEETDLQTSEYRFNIEFLSTRLAAATNWVMNKSSLNELPIAYFGASTGAAAALVAAARLPMLISAVVSRGGRADLAGDSLQYVEAPTLLLIGELDVPVIRLNKEAYAKLHCVKEMEIIPGASHLFEEPGKMDLVASFAVRWFRKHLI